MSLSRPVQGELYRYINKNPWISWSCNAHYNLGINTFFLQSGQMISRLCRQVNINRNDEPVICLQNTVMSMGQIKIFMFVFVSVSVLFRPSSHTYDTGHVKFEVQTRNSHAHKYGHKRFNIRILRNIRVLFFTFVLASQLFSCCQRKGHRICSRTLLERKQISCFLLNSSFSVCIISW
jgi:hypothetical protein